MRFLACLAIAIAVMPATTVAQTTAAVPAAAVPNDQPPDESQWEFSLAAAAYFAPDDDFVQPTLILDRGWLHLEGRYNYEAIGSGSAWIGYNFGGGSTVTWELTPMIGAVFGATDGVAPAYKGSVAWRKLEFYSEGEYVVDTGDSAGSFFYNWSELTVAPVESFRFGLVTQRTRVYQTDREIQRGLLAGVSFWKLDVTAYVFNPDDETPTLIVAVAVTF